MNLDVDALVVEAVTAAAASGDVDALSVAGTNIGAGLRFAADIGLCQVVNVADPLAKPRNAFRLTERGRRFVAGLNCKPPAGYRLVRW